ncbi:hypothetical protein MMC07_002753 [Pseudocyphellaria aurata]|nr:hypothetical protein [Pseudocyphellaria aurata]
MLLEESEAAAQLTAIERKPPAKSENIKYDPNSVLQLWTESEPRYCTLDKKPQLAVGLRRKIAPHKLVVEYCRKDEVTATARTALICAITDIYPDILAGQEPETALSPAQKEALDLVWVPVGRWTSDIFANKTGHTFDILIDRKSLGIAVEACDMPDTSPPAWLGQERSVRKTRPPVRWKG